MNLTRLRRLRDWIERKIRLVHQTSGDKNNPETYSELNLSIEILNYLSECVKRDIIEEEAIQKHFHWSPDPMTMDYNIGSAPTQAPGACASCLAKSPGITSCVHNTK
jgi:hypothetical protein